MKFAAGWNVGYGDKAYFYASSDFETRFKVDWGDGSGGSRQGQKNDDGGRSVDFAGHDYGHDGTYDVTVSVTNSDLPSIHLQALLYGNDTTGLTINSSDLQDLVLTGSGTNMVNVAGGNDVVLGGAGIDHVNGGAGNDMVGGGGGDDVLSGGKNDDRLEGDEGSDQLYGGTGDDYLIGDQIGNNGNDQLFGGDGNDQLIAAFGADQLTGGPGADIFVIYNPFNGGDGSAILDFSGIHGDGDKIDLDDGGHIYNFIGSDNFDGQGSEVREEQGATKLDHIIQLDEDGDGDSDLSFTVHGDVVKAQDFLRWVHAPNPSNLEVQDDWGERAHPAFADVHAVSHFTIV